MLITVLVATLALGTPAAAMSSSSCDLATLQMYGYCPESNNDGTDVVIDGTHDDPGDTDTDPGTWTDDDSDTDVDLPWDPPPDFNFDDCLENWDSYIHCFRPPDDDDETEDEDDNTTTIPDITITDVARFTPVGSAVAGEPDNVGVVGLPTNFVSTASVQTVNGSLFGFPVAVRFTPAGYDFTFGDGSAATTASGGQSWAALGQAQFTPTNTSHTYAERGTYSAQVDVRYTAEVDFGIGWFPISGEVTSAGAPQEIRIFEAHTALVAHTCEQAPNSPGC